MPPFLKISTPALWGALIFGKEKTMDGKSAENAVENTAEVSAESKEIKLTKKQENFCREYIRDYNGTQAAIRAGYSPDSARSIASKLLTKDNILSRVHAIQIEECEKKSINKESVILNLQEVFERCMQMKPAMVWDSKQHKYVESGQYTFNPKGAIEAQAKIGEYLAMFTRNVNANVSGTMETTVKIEDLID